MTSFYFVPKRSNTIQSWMSLKRKTRSFLHFILESCSCLWFWLQRFSAANTIGKLNVAHCTFLQTPDMLKLNISLFYLSCRFNLLLVILLGLEKDHILPVWVTQTWFNIVPRSVIQNIQRDDAYKCWNAVFCCSHWRVVWQDTTVSECVEMSLWDRWHVQM